MLPLILGNSNEFWVFWRISFGYTGIQLPPWSTLDVEPCIIRFMKNFLVGAQAKRKKTGHLYFSCFSHG